MEAHHVSQAVHAEGQQYSENASSGCAQKAQVKVLQTQHPIKADVEVCYRLVQGKRQSMRTN